MRRTNLYKVTSAAIAAGMILSMCGCSAKTSSDNTETVTETESVTESETESTIETGTETEKTSSANDVSENGTESTGESETETEPDTETETETEAEPASEESSASEEETETGDIDNETKEEKTEGSSEKKTTAAETSTSSKETTTSAKETTKAKETTAEETTTEATVQSVSAVVKGTHYIGETLTGADFTVTVTMSDGSTLTNPAGWGASPLTLSSSMNMITVAYEGSSITITVPAETVPETTTALVAEATTAAATTAEIVSEVTTAVETTVAETTTTAPETTAETTVTESNLDDEMMPCKSGDWSYVYAQSLFMAQNELREEAGVAALIWDDQMYEAAKLCAKACGDAGYIDHGLSDKYIWGVDRTAYTGETITVMYDENLRHSCYIAYWGEDPTHSRYMDWARVELQSLKNSEHHYASLISEGVSYGAVAVYRMGDTLYESYLFYGSDDEWIGVNYIW